MPSPARLSYQLRREDSPHLNCRRWLVGLSFVGSAAGMIVGLYQMGVLRRLPDLPVGPFDATRVDASTYAYKRLQTPDGLLMAATYAVNELGDWMGIIALSVLVFEQTDSALATAGLRGSVGPILMGPRAPAHILAPSTTSRGIVNMAAIAASEAVSLDAEA